MGQTVSAGRLAVFCIYVCDFAFGGVAPLHDFCSSVFLRVAMLVSCWSKSPELVGAVFVGRHRLSLWELLLLCAVGTHRFC